MSTRSIPLRHAPREQAGEQQRCERQEYEQQVRARQPQHPGVAGGKPARSPPNIRLIRAPAGFRASFARRLRPLALSRCAASMCCRAGPCAALATGGCDSGRSARRRRLPATRRAAASAVRGAVQQRSAEYRLAALTGTPVAAKKRPGRRRGGRGSKRRQEQHNYRNDLSMTIHGFPARISRFPGFKATPRGLRACQSGAALGPPRRRVREWSGLW
jgi:hypothetical protein